MGHWRQVLSGERRWSCDVGDCIAVLRELPSDSVHEVVTSPPYYGLRKYLPDGHPDQDKEIGAEESPEQYVAKMVEVFREVRRVLHPSGSLFLNLGDSYANDAKSGPNTENGSSLTGTQGWLPAVQRQWRGAGLKKKDMIGVPWAVAFALRGDGWYLRQHCPWVKRNCIADSTADRPGASCEEVFLLSKESSYFFDMEAIKRPTAPATRKDKRVGVAVTRDYAGAAAVYGGGTSASRRMATHAIGNGETRNFRNSDLWFDSVGLLLSDGGDMLGVDVPVKGLKAAHFAVMPFWLVEPLVLSGSSAKGVCPKCGEPWTRVVEKDRVATRPGDGSKVHAANGSKQDAVGKATYTGFNARCKEQKAVGNRDPQRHVTTTRTVGWEPGCACNAGDPLPSVILDPFTGAGTVAKVAVHHGRRFIGSELNPEYLTIINDRMAGVTPPLFT